MDSTNYPLLSHRGIRDMTPGEYRSHIKHICEEQVKYLAELKVKRSSGKSKSVVPGISYRVNKQGTPILTCRRANKSVTHVEVEMLAEAHSLSIREMWNLFISKGYVVTRPEVIINRGKKK